MKVLYWPVGWGKTTALVEQAIEEKGIVVAKSPESKRYIEKKWPQVKVILFEDIKNTCLDDGCKLFIDDADAVLQSIIGEPIGGISITMDRPW